MVIDLLFSVKVAVSNFSRGNKRIKPVSGWFRNSAYLARSSYEGDRNCFSRVASSARLASIFFRMSARDSVCASTLIESERTNPVATKIFVMARLLRGNRNGQTPDFPATHAAVATVAPFPAWRGSQGLRCAEPGI